MTRIVKCPQCKKPTEFSPQNPFRPFCSERCRIIDLGAWADESYKVPARSTDNLSDPEFPDDLENTESEDSN